MVSGLFPIAGLGDLAAMNNVVSVQPAVARTRAGLVTSRGDVSMRTDEARAELGIDGTGVRETLDTVVGLLALRISAKLSGESAGIHLEALQQAQPPDLQERVDAHLAGIQRAEAEAKSASDPRLQYASLEVSNTVRVRYQNESLRGTRPTIVLGASLDGEDIVLDLLSSV